MKTRWIFAAPMIALASLCALAPLRGAAQEPDRKELVKLIPDALPQGVAQRGDPTFFTPDNLYQYMDGGADIFLLYGTRLLMHLDMRAQNIDITVDVFDMGTPDTAFGMYAAERADESHYLAIGAEAYQNQGILNFLEDRYYVKIAAFGEGAETVSVPLAEAFAKKIGSNPGLPALLTALPKTGRKPHSEQYMPNEPLGHSFLAPAYVAAYDFGAKQSKLYVTLARDEADAHDRLTQLEQYFAKTGSVKPAAEIGEGVVRASNSYEGEMLALTRGRYLVLLLSPTSEAGALLNELTKGLQ